MSPRKISHVDSEATPVFGAEDEELHLLRQLRKVCEAEEEVSEDVDWVLQALKRVKKKKKN
jgi:hypothetical protein